MSAASKITAARTDLVLEQPFWGSLILQLPMRPDDTCETAWVNGREMGYNPAFIETLNHDQVKGLLAHEVSHCALGHPWRRDGRGIKRWNHACDIAINGDLIESGFQLPSGGLMPDAEQKGKSAEWIHERLGEDEGDNPGGGSGDGDGDGQESKPDPLGEVRDAPTGADADGTPAPSEQEWKERAASAMQQAKMQGLMPGGMGRAIERALRSRVDVRSLLLRFFSERSASDYTWARPNTRYLSQGLYLPALEGHELGEIAVMVDTSGSVDGVSLQYAKGVLESVIEECNPSAVSVFYVDAAVQHTVRFERGDTLTWEPRGGGGTDFRTFFDRIERGEESPVCVIGISDLAATFPPFVPSVPTLWLSTTEGGTAPFGEVVFLDR